jgi:hypothetical protein
MMVERFLFAPGRNIHQIDATVCIGEIGAQNS